MSAAAPSRSQSASSASSWFAALGGRRPKQRRHEEPHQIPFSNDPEPKPQERKERDRQNRVKWLTPICYAAAELRCDGKWLTELADIPSELTKDLFQAHFRVAQIAELSEPGLFNRDRHAPHFDIGHQNAVPVAGIPVD